MKQAVILITLLLAGFSSNPGYADNYGSSEKSSEAEVQAAVQKQYQCFFHYSSQLDDGQSDVATIARATIDSCERERDGFFYILTRGSGPIDEKMIRQAAFDKDMEGLINHILKNRAENN
jgi:hypothetical protein